MSGVYIDESLFKLRSNVSKSELNKYVEKCVNEERILMPFTKEESECFEKITSDKVTPESNLKGVVMSLHGLSQGLTLFGRGLNKHNGKDDYIECKTSELINLLLNVVTTLSSTVTDLYIDASREKYGDWVKTFRDDKNDNIIMLTSDHPAVKHT